MQTDGGERKTRQSKKKYIFMMICKKCFYGLLCTFIVLCLLVFNAFQHLFFFWLGWLDDGTSGVERKFKENIIQFNFWALLHEIVITFTSLWAYSLSLSFFFIWLSWIIKKYAWQRKKWQWLWWWWWSSLIDLHFANISFSLAQHMWLIY